MYQPQHPHVPTPPTKKLTILAAVAFAAAALLALATIILSLQLVTAHRRLQTKDTELQKSADALNKAADDLTKANRELIVQDLLPSLNSFSSQCPGGNEADSLFTPLSKTPIEGYNVFLVDCRTYIGTGKSRPRVVVFRVNSDGSKELTYGANDAEPLCISNKIPVANKIAIKLSMPVCQTN